MTRDLRLIIFDVDGTLVDSQNDITSAMKIAFDTVGLPSPTRQETLSIVGLSLPIAVSRLAPDVGVAVQDKIVYIYKQTYAKQRMGSDIALTSPLYDGARDMLDKLHANPDFILGIATGKSKRGLDALLEGHDLKSLFVTEQVADFHPSKPHPSMLDAALAETGLSPSQAVMIGDTSFDIEMGRNAGMQTIGVSWGYHAREVLSNAGADRIIDSYDELPVALEFIWKKQP